MKRDDLEKMLGPESMKVLEADPLGKKLVGPKPDPRAESGPICSCGDWGAEINKRWCPMHRPATPTLPAVPREEPKQEDIRVTWAREKWAADEGKDGQDD